MIRMMLYVQDAKVSAAAMQDFAAAFSKLLELGVPFPEDAPAT